MIKFKNKEWEFLQEGINLTDKYKIKTNLKYGFINYCCLSRDDNYEIVLDIKYYLNDDVNLNKIFWFVFENNDEKIILYYCVLDSKNLFVDKNGPRYDLKFRIKNVERIHKNNQNDVNLIKEFYLNSINDKAIFYRKTKYFGDVKCYKVREGEDGKFEESNGIFPKSVAGDWLLLKLKEFSFILQQVHDFGPNWSNNIYFEYKKELSIPSSETRQKNREIISFLLGKYLIKVGETYFDNEGNIIKEVAVLPKISPKSNLKNICNKREVPAIYCRDIMLLESFEKDLSELIEAYLSDNELNLSNILEYLMGSTIIPMEYEIVGIGGCLDQLSKIWFESSYSKCNDFTISKDEFYDTMGEVLPIIKERFKNYSYAYENIQNAYKLSGYGKVKLFLEELNLNQGKAEKKARNYRNISAHAYEMDDEKKLKMVYYTDVYRTFLNRIILKILGYNQYFDLTSYKNILIDNHLPNKDFKENIREIKEFYKDILNPK